MTRIEALKTLVTDPVTLAVLGVALMLWQRRADIVGGVRRAGGRVRAFLARHRPAKIGRPSAGTALIAAACVMAVSQRGCTLPEIRWPSLPNIPVVNPVDPNSVPVSFQGFHVIVVEETGQPPLWLYDLTASPAVQQYLNGKCANGPQGWRSWDQNVPIANAPTHFQEMMGLPRTSLPCVVIAAGGRAVVKPLSEMTPEQFIELLKPYGGE